MKHAPPVAAFALIACLFLVACQMPGEEGCACTADYRANACVSLDGNREIPAGTKVYRHRSDGKDSLVGGTGNPPYGTGNCFGEHQGPYVVEVWRDGAKVAEKTVPSVPTTDCCHHEAVTIDFDL